MSDFPFAGVLVDIHQLKEQGNVNEPAKLLAQLASQVIQCQVKILDKVSNEKTFSLIMGGSFSLLHRLLLIFSIRVKIDTRNSRTRFECL